MLAQIGANCSVIEVSSFQTSIPIRAHCFCVEDYCLLHNNWAAVLELEMKLRRFRHCLLWSVGFGTSLSFSSLQGVGVRG